MDISETDISHLKDLYNYERDRLNFLCDKWQKVLDTSTRATLSEEAKGEILATLGQTRLLISKKLKHYEKLLSDSERGEGDSPPFAMEDLEGLWEVVMIQVNEANSKFKNLETMDLKDSKKVRSKTSMTKTPKTRSSTKHLGH